VGTLNPIPAGRVAGNGYIYFILDALPVLDSIFTRNLVAV
jgi:hypothetical protein